MASSHTEGVDVTAGISGAAKDDLLDGRPVPGLYVFIVFIVIIGAFFPLSFFLHLFLCWLVLSPSLQQV